jgi:hypothetical protein
LFCYKYYGQKKQKEYEKKMKVKKTDGQTPKGRDGAKSKTARLVRTGRQLPTPSSGAKPTQRKTIGQDSRSKESPPLGKKKRRGNDTRPKQTTGNPN